MELLIRWAPLVSLCCVLCGASGDRHTVFWNSTNPRFQRDNYAVEVRLNDYLDIICPHYEDHSVAPHAMERYTLYLVEREEYETCKPHSKEQIRWECNRPDALHGPERFSEKFQRFTPFTLGKEFQEGHEYYYIFSDAQELGIVGLKTKQGRYTPPEYLEAKPIHRHGEACLKLRVMVARRKGHTLPVQNPTQKGKLQSDDPGAPMLRSMGHNSAPRPSSPFTFLGLLPPLLLLLPPRGP